MQPDPSTATSPSAEAPLSIEDAQGLLDRVAAAREGLSVGEFDEAHAILDELAEMLEDEIADQEASS
jgi:hypothetical protein